MEELRYAYCGDYPELPETAKNILFEDLPLEWQEMASILGLETVIKLCWYCGNMSMYVPAYASLTRNQRDREIRARFDGGNYIALAKQYNLSDRQIRKIINGTRV